MARDSEACRESGDCPRKRAVPVERDTLYHEVVRDKPAERRWATGGKLEVVG